MTIKDLRLIADGGTFAESDPSGRMVASTVVATGDTLTCTNIPRNENNYYYEDGGGASTYTGSAYLECDVKITAYSTSANIGSIGIGFGDSANVTGSVAYESGALFLVTNTSISLYSFLRDASTGYTSSNSLVPVLNTQYYSRIGFFSSLGRYGGIAVHLFTNPDRTTLFGGIAYARLSAADYRYLFAAQGTNNATTGTNSSVVANITVYPTVSAGIDLTTATGSFTQTDPSANIADYADCLVCTTLNTNEDAYHYKDYGASYFNGNYILTGALNVTAFATGSGTMLTLLSLMNTVNDGNNTDDKHCVILDYVSASTYTLKAREVSSATGYNSSASSTLNTNQPYWLKERRDTSVGTYGTLYLEIYNDPGMLSQVGSTLSLALHDNGTPDVAAFQYFYPLQSWNTGSSRTTTFTFGGVSQQNQVYNATKGAFSWAGTTATISEQPTSINLGLGAFSWAGKASPLSLMIQATKGPFSWAGKTVNLNTGGQVNTTVGAFSWGGKSSPLSYLVAASKGAFSWAGKTVLVGSTVTSLRTATLTKWDTVTEKEIPDTGLTSVLYMLYDPINLLVYDFSDNTFKASASCVTPQGTMTERVLLNSVGTNLTPGVYDILLATTGLSGLYQEYLFYYGTTNHLDSNPVRFQDGIEYLGGLTVAENTTLNVIPTAAQNATAVWSKTLPL